MNISQAWIIYIGIVILAFLIIQLMYSHVPLKVKLFLAFLVGGLYVAFVESTVSIVSKEDAVWYGYIVLVSYLLIAFLGLWVVIPDYFIHYNNGGPIELAGCLCPSQ